MVRIRRGVTLLNLHRPGLGLEMAHVSAKRIFAFHDTLHNLIAASLVAVCHHPMVARPRFHGLDSPWLFVAL